MTRLSAASGLPRNLREAGIDESAPPMLAEAAMKVERLLRNNPREITLKDALQLYIQAWEAP